MKTLNKNKKKNKKKKKSTISLFNLNKYNTKTKIAIMLTLFFVISFMSHSSISKYELKRIKEYNKLNKYIDEKIKYYKDICIDNSCPEVTKTLSKYKNRINSNPSITRMNIIQKEVDNYLNDIAGDEYNDIFSFMVPDDHKKIAELLNNSELKPMLTSYDELDSKIDSILKEITNHKMTTYEKVKAIYDWEINTMSYKGIQPDYKIIKEVINKTGLSDYDSKLIYLADTILKTKKGTCDYYSALFTILIRRIGLESYSVGAITNNGSYHTSVNIKLDNKYYTFDPQGEDKSLVKGEIKYIFFGKTDNEIGRIQTYPIRNKSIKEFNNFEIVKDVLDIKVKIGDLEFNKRCVDKLTFNYENMIDLEYIKDEKNIPIEVISNKHVNYNLYFKDNDEDSTSNVISGNLSEGRIYFSQEESKSTKMYLEFVDEEERSITYVFDVNFIEYGTSFKLSAKNIDVVSESEVLIELEQNNGELPIKDITCNISLSNDFDKQYNCERLEDENKIIFKLSELKKGYYYIIDFSITDNLDRLAKFTYTLNKLV